MAGDREHKDNHPIEHLHPGARIFMAIWFEPDIDRHADRGLKPLYLLTNPPRQEFLHLVETSNHARLISF